MPRLKIEITPAQEAFLKRKKLELRRLVPPSAEPQVTDDNIIQGMLSFYMGLDAAERCGDPSRIRELTT